MKISMMTKKSFSSLSWKEFFLEDIVTIANGKRLTKIDMSNGNIPFVGASEMLNGITAFTSTKNESLDKNVLGVNYNGSVGCSFYHPYMALFSDDVKRVKWKDSRRNNKYTLLFLASSIMQQKIKYAYGYKFNSQRMRRQKILLPVCVDGTPDWQFMEEFMKEKERLILKTAKEKLNKQLEEQRNNSAAVADSELVEFKDFVFGELFSINASSSGIDKSKLNGNSGHIPYITRSNVDNAIADFIGKQNIVLGRMDEGNVITIGLDTQSVFYQPKAFYTGQNIQVIRHERLNKYNALYVVECIKKLVSKFSWGSYGATLSRLRRGKLYLPVDSSGEPNWDYMEQKSKEVETRIILKYLNAINNKYKDEEDNN